MRRNVFLSTVGAAALLPTATTGQGLAKVRIAGTPDEDMVGSFWAQQSGIFQKYGIDADVRTINSGAAITAAVIGGSLEIGRSSLLNLILAHAKGIPVVMVATSLLWNSATPASALIVAKSSTVRSGKDLDGMTLASSSIGDFYALMDSAWIDAHGGDSSSVKFVEISGRAAADAVAAGRVTATTLARPMLDQVMATGQFRIVDYPFNAVAKQFVLTAYFTTADYLAKNADTVARFRRALAESVTYVDAHRAEMLPVIAKFSGTDEATIAAMPPLTLPPPRLNVALVQPLIDVAVKYKRIDTGFAAKDMIDPAALS
jgi:NitT/TauT family transport system substrate-binding protein